MRAQSITSGESRGATSREQLHPLQPAFLIGSWASAASKRAWADSIQVCLPGSLGPLVATGRLAACPSLLPGRYLSDSEDGTPP